MVLLLITNQVKNIIFSKYLLIEKSIDLTKNNKTQFYKCFNPYHSIKVN